MSSKTTRIMVLGETGVGRSTFIRRAGAEPGPVIGHSILSEAQSVQEFEIKHPTIANCSVLLVDTPGFDDSSGVDESPWNNTVTWLKDLEATRGPYANLDGIIYLHDVSHHFTGGMNAIQLPSRPALILALTKLSFMSEVDQNHSKQELERRFPGLSKVQSFDNSPQSAWQVIDLIIARKSTVPLLDFQNDLERIIDQEREEQREQRARQERQEQQEQQDRIINQAASHVLSHFWSRVHSLSGKLLNQCREMIRRSKQVADKTEIAPELVNEISVSKDTSSITAADKMKMIHQVVDEEIKTEDMSLRRLADKAEMTLSSIKKTWETEDKDDIVILIMGQIGSGKSTFINCLLEREEMEVSSGLEACTKNIKPVIMNAEIMARHLPDAKDRRVIIVDTPGIGDNTTIDTGALVRITQWLQASYIKKMELAGVVYLHDISHPHVTGPMVKSLGVFQKLCGKDAFESIIIGTTKWDLVEEETGLRQQTDLCDSSWKDMTVAGTRIMPVSYTPREPRHLFTPWNLVQVFLARKNSITLTIQHELVDMKKSFPGTEAGKALKYTSDGLSKDRSVRSRV